MNARGYGLGVMSGVWLRAIRSVPAYGFVGLVGPDGGTARGSADEQAQPNDLAT